jgi:hypothetical protein
MRIRNSCVSLRGCAVETAHPDFGYRLDVRVSTFLSREDSIKLLHPGEWVSDLYWG